eukprot:754145-Hanusia_phi.AAC.3
MSLGRREGGGGGEKKLLGSWQAAHMLHPPREVRKVRGRRRKREQNPQGYVCQAQLVPYNLEYDQTVEAEEGQGAGAGSLRWMWE